MGVVEILSMLFSAAFTVIGGVVLYKFKQVDAERLRLAEERKKDIERSIRENKAVIEGLRAVLKTLLMQQARRFEKQGFAPMREVEDFQSMYNTYHNLGGNGFITDLLQEVKRLPHEPEVTA